MEKIKASDILAMSEELSLTRLKKFAFFAVDKDGTKVIFKDKPKFYKKKEWYPHGGYCSFEVYCICEGEEITESESKNSLREIDFSEEEDQHYLTLTDGELHEIVLLAKKIKTHEADI